MKYRLFLVLVFGIFICVFLVHACNKEGEKSHIRYSNKFVGDQVCQSCHSNEFMDWSGSHHDYAMRKATEETVRGDFSSVSYFHRGEIYRFFRHDSLYMVESSGPDGEQNQYQITHTFGWTPLQQYLVDFGKGKLQVFNIGWDTEKKKWFALNPEQDIQHGDWLHWTGGAMNWNTMCADCHSTNLKQNYIASADSFHTTWSSINVSCEACHGPGRDHVDFVQSEEADRATIDRIRADLRLTSSFDQQQQITQCAQCHSLREALTGTYRHEGDFLDHYSPTLPHPEAYFEDGQIKQEVYVYGSFLQSKMFKKGVKCSDCHNPHSLKLKANVTDNSLCMQCHEPRYNTLTHHKHQPNTEASQCISCHMPGRYYMEIDFRRDHSFRVPRPDLSAQFDTPNACNDCHSGQSSQWAAGAIRQWYGPNHQDHFSDILANAHTTGSDALPDLKQLVADTSQPDIARATALWYIGQYPTQESMPLLEQTLNDPNPLVRISTARTLNNFPKELKELVLQDALDDSIRAVRLAAAEGLAELSASDMLSNFKQSFTKALKEYKKYLYANRYFPQGQMNRGQFLEKQGQHRQAMEAYQKALQKDNRFNPARINLAYLYNRQGNNAEAVRLLKEVIDQESGYGPAYYSLALLLAEQQQLSQALSYFEGAAQRMPENSRVRYNWAISLQRLDQLEKAESVYLEAIKLAPENPDYLYGICTLYIQQSQFQKALPHARALLELMPNSQKARDLLEYLKQRLD